MEVTGCARKQSVKNRHAKDSRGEVCGDILGVMYDVESMLHINSGTWSFGGERVLVIL